MADPRGLIAALIAALVEAFKEGVNRRRSLGSGKAGTAGKRVARRTAAERSGVVPAVVPTPASDVPGAPPAQVTRSGLASDSGLARAGATVGPSGPVDRVAEASLVRTLFATPQSLVAAFIVAEVLAKPVALREP